MPASINKILAPEGGHTVELRHFLNMPEVYYVCRCIIMYIIVLQYFFFTGPRSLLVMGTGNPGVSPEQPRPVPLNTLTLGAGRGISRVRVWVWRGFEGIRVG